MYSFILTGVRKEHYKNLTESFRLGLLQLLEADGFSMKEIQYLMQGTDVLTYSKTHSKKVLGNMNDLVWLYGHHISSSGGMASADIGDIIHRLNRVPQRNNDWEYAVASVAKLAKNA